MAGALEPQATACRAMFATTLADGTVLAVHCSRWPGHEGTHAGTLFFNWKGKAD